MFQQKSSVKTCFVQMDDIRLPMMSGTMDDISEEGEGGSSQDTPLDSMSSQVRPALLAAVGGCKLGMHWVAYSCVQVAPKCVTHPKICLGFDIEISSTQS